MDKKKVSQSKITRINVESRGIDFRCRNDSRKNGTERDIYSSIARIILKSNMECDHRKLDEELSNVSSWNPEI